MKKAMFILAEHPYKVIYAQPERDQIAEIVDVCQPHHTAEAVRENPSVLNDIEIVFSGWGSPKWDKELLDNAPNLKLILYGAGSIKGIVTDEMWDRGIKICSAWGANAVPVAEYTLSQIIWCLKRGWEMVCNGDGAYPKKVPVAGAYKTTVGIISLGMIGKMVCDMMKKVLDVNVIAYDPFAKEETAKELNVQLVSLEEVFEKSDVVSVHTPWLKETENMITGKHIASMKQRSSIINSSRGAVINEPEMIEVLQKRKDIYAVLDVTYPEPPVEGSPLYTMKNVVLTPHIAGSMDYECRRMGQYMIDECKRYLAGEDLKWSVTKEQAAIMA
ncbi:MAG: hydroxyacid dehydrogenase [Armatimonadota bacterium]